MGDATDSNLHVAHVRLMDGDDHLRLQLTLYGDQKTFYRPVSEKLDKIRYRLQLLATQTVDHHAANASSTATSDNSNDKQLKRKNASATSAHGHGHAGMSAASQARCVATCMAARKVPVHFIARDGTELVGKHVAIGDALVRTSRLRIGHETYVVLLNQPRVLQLHTLTPVLVGIPIVPLPTTEFCSPEECTWHWTRLKDDADANDTAWDVVSCARRYVPTAKDIGCRFRIRCLAPSMHSEFADESAAAVVTTPVVAGPDRSVFAARRAMGAARASTDGSAFRVMSYNVLYDGYTATPQAKSIMFPYAKPEILEEMYRMQLVYQELDESQGDIVCCQEMGQAIFTSFFEPTMSAAGYHAFYSGKTGTTHEGCAVFVRRECFDVLEEHTLDLALAIKQSPDPAIQAVLRRYPEIALGLSKIPSIAQLLILRCRANPARHIVLANTHLFYREDSHLIRLLQAVVVARELEKARLDVGGHTAVVLTGDLNAFPHTAPIDFLLDAYIDCEHEHWLAAPAYRWDRRATAKLTSKLNDTANAVEWGCFEHNLQLVSACGTPDFTNYAGTFVGTLDYILVGTERLRVKREFPAFSRQDVSTEVALPSSVFPSDHVSLICDLTWKAEQRSRRSSVASDNGK